ncbi:DUF6515 family protein [Sulfurospirillum sp. 1612]|uniref:DUF6515 family protein n=1 Tax=Sulfurospirillum sp. 1612 TaxID=3094835 RepID=UPI002F91C267
MYGQNILKLLILCCFVGASLYAAPRSEEYKKHERKAVKKTVHQQKQRVVKHKVVHKKVVHKKVERRTTKVQVKKTRVVQNRNVKHYKSIPKARRWGRVVHSKPSQARMFRFKGIRYYRHNGVFYKPHQGAYIIVRPPIGAIVPVLPVGYALMHLYGQDYYVYDQTYYVWSDSPQGYRIVESPSQPVSVSSPQYVDDDTALDTPYAIGTVFESLPAGATERILNGVNYYWIDGHYLSKSRQNGHDVYIVVNPR